MYICIFSAEGIDLSSSEDDSEGKYLHLHVHLIIMPLCHVLKG